MKKILSLALVVLLTHANRTYIINAYDSIFAGSNVTWGIQGNVKIHSNSDVTFNAGKGVVLKTGFQVDSGGIFHAQVGTLISSYNIQERTNENTEYLPLLNNTSWTNISYGFEPPMIATICKIIKDTIIDNKNYKTIRRFRTNIGESSFSSNVIETKYLYENYEEKKVYSYDQYSNEDILLYDFSLQPGKTLPGNPQFILREISTIDNSGYTRKKYVFANSLSDTIVWIEGIGNYTDLLNPIAMKHDNISRILCVRNNVDVVYDTGDFRGYTCDDLSNIFDLQSIENNPIKDVSIPIKYIQNGHLFIQSGKRLYNAQGKKVK